MGSPPQHVSRSGTGDPPQFESCSSKSDWPPQGSGAAAPGGALRAIDSSASLRSWRTCGPCRLRRQSQACPGRRSGWYGMTGPSASWGSLERRTVADGRRSERHTGRPDRWRPRTNQAAQSRASSALRSQRAAAIQGSTPARRPRPPQAATPPDRRARCRVRRPNRQQARRQPAQRRPDPTQPARQRPGAEQHRRRGSHATWRAIPIERSREHWDRR